MKSILYSALLAVGLGIQAQEATVNWAAGIDNGLSLANGTAAPVGTIVRLGWFRDATTGLQLTDSEIEVRAESPSALNVDFVEVATTTVGSGFMPAIASHFAANSSANTGNGGLAVAGRQMYVWVLDGPLATATQQAILYWDATDLTTNPDSAPQPPGVRWVFPGTEPVPGVTTIDLTDLTTGLSTLAAGARVVVGSFPAGTSPETGAPNFGLEVIDDPLAIVTAPNLPGGVVSSTYSTSLVASGGRSPFSWSVTGGTLPGGMSLAANGTLSGVPTTASTFNFTATVTDDIGAAVAKSFTLIIASANVSISTAGILPTGVVGANYSQTLTGTGGTSPYTFALTSGALPGTVTLASSGIVSGVLGPAGDYTFEATITDAAGLTASKSFLLTVNSLPAITSPSVLPQAVVGVAYSYQFAVFGGGSYTWSTSGGTLPPGLTLSAAGQLTGTPSTAGNYNFSLAALGSNGGTSTKSFSIVVNADLVAPTMDDPQFPVTVVSANFSSTISASPASTSFTAAGLPAGLKLVGNQITGRPTVSGVFMVTLKARNGRGFGPALVAPLVVQALPAGAVGTFIGMIERDAGVNSNLGGRIDLTTTLTGAFTLKVTQGTTTASAKGVMDTQVGQAPSLSATVGGRNFLLTFDAPNHALAGTATSGIDSADVEGWKNVWNKTTNPATALAGYYSFGLDLTTDIGTVTVPQGTGYASFTVATDGKLAIKGKAADGSAVATAGFVAADGSVLVYQQMYAKLGSMVGVLTLNTDPDANFTENEISGQVTWSKPATTGRTYPALFGPLVLDAEGKYLARAAKGSLVLGLPASTSTANLDFSEGGLTLANQNPDAPSFTYTSAFQSVITGSATKTTLKITAPSGLVGGSFSLVDGALTRSVTFSGMIIRYADGTTRAGGYFLAPQIPVGAETIRTSPILSGKVAISQ
jgi:hypothetical protein